MGARSSCSDSRSLEKKLKSELDVASDGDSSTDGDTAEIAAAAAAVAVKATPPTQTQQQENKTQQTDVEKLEKQKEKKRQQEEAYREISVEDVWLEAENTVDPHPPSLQDQETQRTGWHTVRIFVSSTFRDFHTERDLLVKKVRLHLCFARL